MAGDAAALQETATPKAESWREVMACLFLSCQLTLDAYWTRLRQRRNPFSPTLPRRSRPLTRASLQGRVLSQVRYLRPTRNCDCHAPEVVALADEIRERAGSDWDYAHAIFDLATNTIDHCFERPPRRGVVGTLERGFGTCHEKINLLVALARAGGIPARYCTIGVAPGQAGVVSLTHDDSGIFGSLTQPLRRFLADDDNDPRAMRIVALFLTYFSKIRRALEARAVAGTLPTESDNTHYIVEFQLGQLWIPVDPTSSDAECAAYNLPLQRFGYQPLVLGKLMGMVITDRSEAIPRRRSIRWHFHVLLARGLFDHVNVFGEKGRARGRKILAEVGREACIRRRRHLYWRIPAVAELGVSLPPYPST